MNELEQISERLHWLRTVKATRDRRAEAEALLDSKWEGVQVLAGQVLAAWGGRDSIAPLRSWLERILGQPDARIIRPAADAVGHCVGEEDAEWALDLYFRAGPDDYRQQTLIPLRQQELFPLLQGLPRSSTVPLLERRARSGDKGARYALRGLEAIDQLE